MSPAVERITYNMVTMGTSSLHDLVELVFAIFLTSKKEGLKALPLRITAGEPPLLREEALV